MRAIRSITFAVALAGTSAGADAALFARGADMVYDDATGLTWMRAATYAVGSAFDDGNSPTDGRMTFDSAVAWAAQLSVSFNGQSVSGWRLPELVAAMDSEVMRLVQGTLGNPAGRVPSNWGAFAPLPDSFIWFGSPYTNPAPLGNFVSVDGWLVKEPVHVWPPSLAWGFVVNDGVHLPAVVRLDLTNGQSYQQQGYAWAVRTGDVAQVAEPSTLALLGFMPLAAAATRRRSQTRARARPLTP